MEPKSRSTTISFDEHQISLEDNLVQIFSEPTTKSLLNLDFSTKRELGLPTDSDSLLTLYFDLSEKIKVESRVVTNIPTLFSDLGGLYSFFATIVVLMLGRIHGKLYLIDQVSTMFRESGLESQKTLSSNDESKGSNFSGLSKPLEDLESIPSLSDRQNLFKAISLGYCEALRFIYGCLFCSRRDKRLRKLLDLGEAKI